MIVYIIGILAGVIAGYLYLYFQKRGKVAKPPEKVSETPKFHYYPSEEECKYTNWEPHPTASRTTIITTQSLNELIGYKNQVESLQKKYSDLTKTHKDEIEKYTKHLNEMRNTSHETFMQNLRLKMHQTILLGLVKCENAYKKECSDLYDGYCHRITIGDLDLTAGTLYEAVQKFADYVQWGMSEETNPRDIPPTDHPAHGKTRLALRAYRFLCERVEPGMKSFNMWDRPPKEYEIPSLFTVEQIYKSINAELPTPKVGSE